MSLQFTSTQGKTQRSKRRLLALHTHTVPLHVTLCGGLWERRPAPLSPQLSAIIIALLLAAKMATGDYNEGEMKGQNHNPGSGKEGSGI